MQDSTSNATLTSVKSDFLDTLRRAIIDSADAAGIEPATAGRLAEQVELTMRQNLGGGTCYIQAPSKTERNRQIREAYRRGVDVQNLAVRYSLTESRVRQIVARQFDGAAYNPPT